MAKDHPVAIHDLLNWKLRGERIPMITAYDYTSIQVVEAARIPVVLVGDTLGMVVLGYDTTIPVTLEDMIHHVRAVMRGRSNALVIGDLPFMSYQVSEGQALTSAARLVQEGGCHAVKLEGGRERALDLGNQMTKALKNYADEVRSRSFPEAKHSTSMDLDVLQHVIERIDARC